MDILNVPKRYIPDVLTKKDKKKQKKNLRKSRKLYKQGKYFSRPKVKSFKSRKSNHLQRAELFCKSFSKFQGCWGTPISPTHIKYTYFTY